MFPNHLLTTEGLSHNAILTILDKAASFFTPEGQLQQNTTLQGITVANLFFEPSTRTRSTFELAAKKLSAHVLNLSLSHSSITKGETLLDTVKNLQAMQCQLFVLRHMASGAAHFIASHVSPQIGVINAGDGCHAHPTQALLDLFTIRKYCSDFQSLRIAIVGDIYHSRVARSQIHALQTLRTGEIRVIGPKTLLPPHINTLGVNVFYDPEQGLKDVDVIMMLRIQHERMQAGRLPLGEAYYRTYGLTAERLALAAPNAIIMHPGPVNRGVEMQSELIEHPQSVILDQVTNGIAVRMAVMSLLMEHKK